MRQVTASKTTLFLNCQWSFSPDVEVPTEETVDEAPRYGSAFHKLLEDAPLEVGAKLPASFAAQVDNVGVTFDLSPTVREELAGHVRGSLPVLHKWLGGKNKFDWKFDVKKLKRETSHALKFSDRIGRFSSRVIAGPTSDGHVYEELGKKNEIAMTADLEDLGFVMDHKTGSRDDHFATPYKNDQLKTLALADGATEATSIVAIFHADRRGLPIIYAEELPASAKQRHARKLSRAMRRVGDGSMRPGEWCKYCPARSICPTQTAELLTGVASLVEGGSATLAKTSKADALATPEAIGAMHQFFAEFDRLKERARPLMRARVKSFIEEGKFSRRPDGKVLVLRSRLEERLSKKAISDALGVKEAERLFERLRKAGALVTTESEGLYAEFPD